MMASPMGRDGFDRPLLLAQGLRLLIFRHPLRPVVGDLVLSFGHGDRRSRSSCTRLVILGGYLVMRHVIALINLSVMHATDLLEGRGHMLQEMKSVGNLGGSGRPLPHA